MADEDIKNDLLAIWVAFTEAIIRFWNNRFIKENDEIVYLRMQIAKLQEEKSELVLKLFDISKPVAVNEDIEDKTDYKPINQGYVPWHIKQRQLELASRQKAKELAEEVKEKRSMEQERAKTTEELEKELLG